MGGLAIVAFTGSPASIAYKTGLNCVLQDRGARAAGEADEEHAAAVRSLHQGPAQAKPHGQWPIRWTLHLFIQIVAPRSPSPGL